MLSLSLSHCHHRLSVQREDGDSTAMMVRRGSLWSSVTLQGRGHQLTWRSQLAEDSAADFNFFGNAEKFLSDLHCMISKFHVLGQL